MFVAIFALFGRRAGRELYRTRSERRASNIHRSGALILHNLQNSLLRELAACHHIASLNRCHRSSSQQLADNSEETVLSAARLCRELMYSTIKRSALVLARRSFAKRFLRASRGSGRTS